MRNGTLCLHIQLVVYSSSLVFSKALACTQTKLWQKMNCLHMLMESWHQGLLLLFIIFYFSQRQATQVKMEPQCFRSYVWHLRLEDLYTCASILPPTELSLVISGVNVEWVFIRHNVFFTLKTLSFFPCLRLAPSSSSGKQHITLTDSSNHSTVFAWQVQNVTDTQLIG